MTRIKPPRESASSGEVGASSAIAPPGYPFTALVGQEEMKLALLLNVVVPAIGGVLLTGHRGTGKSTAVRSLASTLPRMTKVRGCVFNCDPAGDDENFCAECHARRIDGSHLPREQTFVPVVDLPLGATEDRVCGSINIERALGAGVKVFEPGLLARANRGFLYVDEVNLLEDNLVDLLLDVSATGRHIVEREGISTAHPSRFVLVGSGNPEEGELRPQLLDRFGLCVEVRTTDDVAERVEIVERREAFDRDPYGFASVWDKEQSALARRLRRAQKSATEVVVPRSLIRHIAELCARLKIDGHRGELTTARAARALAALEGRREVTLEDVERVAALALRHRLRRDPLGHPLDQTSGGGRVEQTMRELSSAGDSGSVPESARRPRPDTSGSSTESADGGRNGEHSVNQTDRRQKSEAGTAASPTSDSAGAQSLSKQQSIIPSTSAELPDGLRGASVDRRQSSAHSPTTTRRARGASGDVTAADGRYFRSTARRPHHPRIALDATLQAAALTRINFQHHTPTPDFPVRGVTRDNLRYKQFRRKSGALFIFAVDTSGSMALNRIGQAKGALAELLRRSYVNRDRIALISFRDRNAELLLSPSRAPARARGMLDALPVGGATPLAAGLCRALDVAGRAARIKTEEIKLLIFTDGRANVPLDDNTGSGARAVIKRVIAEELTRLGAALRRAGVVSVVVNTQQRWTGNGEAEALAEMLGGRCVNLPGGIASDSLKLTN
ncbi:MAG: magnesium chelatase ATPase subunit I [Acidobacteriota bacterium]|nr:magnesium chelatase ATPase subunit I [Acidobacteriota bacterium]